MADEFAEMVTELSFLTVKLLRFLATHDPPQFSANQRIPPAPGTTLRESAGKVLDLELEPQEQEPAPKAKHIYPVEFEAFWKAYPLKKDKLQALKAYAKARKSTHASLLLDAAKGYRDDPNRDDSYTKFPATWLNAGAYLDEDALPSREQSPADRYAAEQAAERAEKLAFANRMIAEEREQRESQVEG